MAVVNEAFKKYNYFVSLLKNVFHTAESYICCNMDIIQLDQRERKKSAN